MDDTIYKNITWVAAEHKHLTAERFDDTIILFDARSGQTHIINPLAYDILNLLNNQPANLTTVADRLFQTETLSDNEMAGLVKIMHQLDGIGLIEPAPIATP